MSDGHTVKVVYPTSDYAVHSASMNRYFIDGKEFDLVTRFKMDLSPSGFNEVTLSFLVREIVFEKDDAE